MSKKNQTSIEEKVEDIAKCQLNELKIKYFAKTESINSEIDEALKNYGSKSGGKGKNYPDIKCLIDFNNRKIPVMIEVKGRSGDLKKLAQDGSIDMKPSFVKNFAVNGAVHYAKAILALAKSYTEVIAIGFNGYEEAGKIKTELEAHYVSHSNFGIPQKISDYSDLSFLNDTKILCEKIDALSLTQKEIEQATRDVEDEIENSLTKLSQLMHDKHNISEDHRVRIVAGMVMAGLMDLKALDLKSEDNTAWNDGQVFMTRIEAFLNNRTLPEEKKKSVKRLMSEVFPLSQRWKPINGQSQLKEIYTRVEKEIVPYFRDNKYHLDFTGKLFNVLNRWVKIPDNKKNDVVLTPRYICEFMVKLAKVNRDSYVWDYAMGTGGFLISAMKEMLRDCENIKSESERKAKELKIKAEQLLGLEILPDIYVLAVLNMILMNDGSANVINKDSLLEYNGDYEQGNLKGEPFPANVFLLNPPYSEKGKGFIFVEKALLQMSKGRAAILIQENAGSGNGLPYTKNVLQKNRLVASIHMSDIFRGKAGVQTAIYVFDVGEAHNQDDVVTFIDFSNDGYNRQNRKKSSANVNLKDTDNAKARYEEVCNIVLGRKPKTNFYTEENGLVIKDTVTLEGNDWTFSQHKKIDTKPTEADFRKTVADYLSWKVSTILKEEGENSENFQ